MPKDLPSALPRWGFVLLGSAALLLLVYGLGGARYGSNDDLTLQLLLQGLGAAQPVDNLPIYFLGWAHITAALYTWLPAFPWYDCLQVASLYVVLATFFYLLAASLPAGRWGWQWLAVGGLLVASSYAIHLWQVNFTRPALLLAAAAAGGRAGPPPPSPG